MNHGTLLIDETPIVVSPTMAVGLGINKAIILQQLHFLLNVTRKSRTIENFVSDKWWVYNSYKQWQHDYFPWLAVVTIKQLFLELERAGIILSMQSVKNPSDRRKWYSIDYEVWNNLAGGMVQKRSHPPLDENYPVMGSKPADGYTENTTEIKDNAFASSGDDAPRAANPVNGGEQPKLSESTIQFKAELKEPLPSSAVVSPTPKPKRANPNEPLHNALLEQFGFDPGKVTNTADRSFWTAAAELAKINFPVVDVPGLHKYVTSRAQREKWSVKFGVMALSKYAPDFLLQRDHKQVKAAASTENTALAPVPTMTDAEREERKRLADEARRNIAA